MKRKILKLILVSLLIMLLTMADFILVGYNFVLAVSENLGEQNITSNIQNVEFNVYFKQDDSKIYEKQLNVDVEDTLILYIGVKDKGILNDAKIQMNEANFEIVKEKVQNPNIKEINEEANEITLNPIASGNSIEIEIPIKFKKQNSFNANYFEQENIITISGIYKDETEQSVTSQRSLKINWSAETDVNLSQSIEKFIGLGDNGVLLQQNIITTVIDDKLPREQETLEINVPVIEEQKPKEIYALLNGEKVESANINYDENTNLLRLQNADFVTTDNQTLWGNAENEYQIIYIYPSEIGEENKTIQLNTTLNTKLFTKDEIQKQDMQEVEISKTGSLVNIEKDINLEQIYKGYLYANTQNEITFTEDEKLNISYTESIENIELDTLENQFVNADGVEFSASNSISYKGLIVNKANIIEMLGQDGNITIQDENNTVIAVINAATEADENGNINITYSGDLNNLKIIISKPITEGTLTLRHLKALKGENTYAKEELKSFTALVARSKVIAGLGEEIGEANILLQDTKTDAKITLNNTNLSTLQTNENVQMLITLTSNNEQYDLYKNPYVEIILPKELSVNVKNITQLNKQDELTVVHPTMHKNEAGETIIQMQLQGEQTSFENNINEGIQISIIADISIENTVPSMASQIVMNYTNENREGESFTSQVPITINSKYGVLLVNELSNYNSNGDVLESIDDKVKEGTLDTSSEAKIANQEITILNNYESEITDIELIAKMPEGEDLSNIKSFELELENNTLEAGEVSNILSEIEIPENLDYNQSIPIELDLSYNYLGDSLKTSSTMILKTANGKETEEQQNGEQPSGDTEEQDPLSIEVQARTGGEYLKDGESVKEGQGIKYLLKLTNNTEEDMKNIKVTANHTNAIFYDVITYNDGWDSVTYEENQEYTRIEENEDLKEKVFKIETLAPGESIELNYQFSVKEVIGELEKTSGQILVQADGQEDKTIQTIENPIEQAEIKLQMRNKYNEEYPIATTNDLPFFLDVTNISDEVQNNIILNVPVPEGFTFDTELLFQTGGYEFIEYKDNVITLEIPTLNVDETINIRLGFHIDGIDLNLDKKDFDFYYTANIGDTKYISNEMSRTIYQGEARITAVQTGSIEGEEVTDGDNLVYTVRVENRSTLKKDVSISDMVPNGAVINSVKAEIYDITTGEIIDEKEIEANQYNLVSYETKLEENQRLDLVINTTIDINQIFESKLTNVVDITVPGQEVICNEVTYTVIGVDDDDNNNDDQNQVHGIKGTVWLDENKNGMREDTEELLDNIGVILINEETGEVATNENGEECVTVTGSQGGYEFENLAQGKYLVVFKYDTSKYLVTEYQKNGISENRNSDVISKTITLDNQEQEVAITGSLTLGNSDLEDIDAGLMESDKFDLKLDKYVSKVIVQNRQGTKVTTYQKEKLAKVEIDAKSISNSTVIIEYQIEVENQGEVPGYVNEIVDYAPKDLNFSSEMNQNWYQGVDGNLYTKELSDQIINPGETKTVTLTLTKAINQNNTGNIINSAEINRASNNFSLSDIDSTPGNQANGEDDKSTAEVLVSIRTGEVIGYTALTLTIIAIIAIGTYFINKKVLNPDEEDEF